MSTCMNYSVVQNNPRQTELMMIMMIESKDQQKFDPWKAMLRQTSYLSDSPPPCLAFRHCEDTERGPVLLGAESSTLTTGAGRKAPGLVSGPAAELSPDQRRRRLPSSTWMITWASSVSLPTLLPRFLASTVRMNLFWNSQYCAVLRDHPCSLVYPEALLGVAAHQEVEDHPTLTHSGSGMADSETSEATGTVWRGRPGQRTSIRGSHPTRI